MLELLFVLMRAMRATNDGAQNLVEIWSVPFLARDICLKAEAWVDGESSPSTGAAVALHLSLQLVHEFRHGCC